MTNNTPKNFLQLAVAEAQNYLTIDQMEKALENKTQLEHLPVQPLYLAYSSLPIAKKAELLPSLSKSQRELFMDIDLWKKDELNVDQFTPWLTIYAACEDEMIQYEFTKSSEFILFFKGRFNVWTFDVEDPLYPDHDNYFLTDDSLLLIEYDEDFKQVEELKLLIKNLYTQEGVEAAYTYLFKLVADQMSSLQEDEYRFKKNRLEDIGMVDYFDALEKTNRFPSKKHLVNFIRLAKSATGSLELETKSQVPHLNFLVPLSEVSSDLDVELSKVTDQHRIDFLKFNLVKLINADIEISGGLSLGTIALTKGSRRVKNFLQLGFEFARNEWKELDRDGVFFDYFTMTDLYRFGKTLIETEQSKLNKRFSELELDETFDSFLGHWAENFIAQAFSHVEIEDFNSTKINLETMEGLTRFEKLNGMIYAILPFAKAFKSRFSELIGQGSLSDNYYLNYNLDEIDFNALILSNLAQFSLGLNLDGASPKLALTISEYKEFATLHHSKQIAEKLDQFISTFGLNEIPLIKDYLEHLMSDTFDGVDITDLSDDEFKHMGGPIVLAHTN